jgi:hypothetical protein
MTGAPAYLVHILYFAEHCKANDKGETPYDVLIKRVPYLPFLPLTCKNTNTEMSYVRVMLEILEFFASKKTIDNMPAYDSGSDDWEVAYLETSKNAYKLLSKQCYPFSLPYHQPLDEVRTWLSKSKTSYRELLQLFNFEGSTDDTYLVKEYLSLSDEEYSLLTAFKIDNDAVPVFKLYGFNDAGSFKKAFFGENGVSEFLKKTGLQYTELIEILKAQFINPAINSVNYIQDLFTGGPMPGDEVFTNLKDIRNTASNDPGLVAKIQQLLAKSNNPSLNPKLLKKYIDDNFDSFQQTIIINPDANDPCNFNIAKLSTILSSNDVAVIDPVNDDNFKKLYFFIRLLKKTGWEVKVIDQLLAPVSKEKNNTILSNVTFFYRLKEKFDLTPAQFICLTGTPDPLQPESIYAQLFPFSSSKAANNGFGPDEFGSFFTTDVFLRAGDKYNAELLSATNISIAEMDALTAYLTISNPDTFKLTVEAISVFYSFRLLSDVHAISITTLLSLIKVSAKSDALRVWDDVNKVFKVAKPASLLALTDLAGEITASGYTIEELLYITGANESDPAFQLSADKIKSLLSELQQEFARIESENIQAKDLTEDLVKNKILTLYDKDVVAQAIGVLNGKIVYSINLPAKPNLTIPANLQSKIQYDQATGKLQVNGVLTLADKTILAANNQLDDTLKPIWNKPFDFLKEQFSTFITDDNTRNGLLDRVNNQATPAADKLKAFYNLYRPYLIKQLGHQSLTAKTAGLLSLHVNVTGLISDAIIDDLYTQAQNIAKQISITTEYFPAKEIADITQLLVSLNKGGLFISKFTLTTEEIEYFLKNAADFSGIDFRTITLAQWRQVRNYKRLIKINRSKEFSFIDLFSLASSGATIESLTNFINLLTQWPKDEISNLISADGLNAASFKNESALLKMSTLFAVASRTSFKVSRLAEWTQYDTTFDAVYKLAAAIKEQVLQQYVPAARVEAESKIGNDILDRQRNALVDFILCMDEIKNEKITTIDELCGYFLIDVPMSANMPTTRIRQAMSTVQSFFKRCLMGIESVKEKITKKEVGVAPSQIDNDIWEPKSFFRTWQVTMEFLTHPYPYLSYKYLIEKSESAKTLEGTITKSDITQRNVEDAYRVYLQDMTEIANLEVAAIFIDDTIDVDNDPSTKFIHVIAKSRQQTHKYYYCTKNESGRWSYLQQIPIAVKEDDGDGYGPGGSHLIFTKFRDRYYLFMPEFVKRQDKSKSMGGQSAESLRSVPFGAPPVLWEVKIAYSELFQGKWTKKSYLSIKGGWGLFNSLTDPAVSNYLFNIDKDTLTGDSLVIQLFTGSLHLMTFDFFSPNSALIASTKKPTYTSYSGNYQHFKASKWQERIFNGDDDDFRDVFKRADSEVFFSLSPQYSFSPDVNINLNNPFFIHDANRAFYVTSTPFTHRSSKANYGSRLEKYGSAILVDVLKKPTENFYLPLYINAKN